MDLSACLAYTPYLLMEGALGERLKREFHLRIDGPVGMADLIYLKSGRKALQTLWQEYRSIAEAYRLPFLATTPTRRCNRERTAKSVYPESILKDNVAFLQELKTKSSVPVYTGGLMGCKGDAYTGEGCLTTAKAHSFHSWQADRLAAAGADFLYAGIMPALEEAKGMAMAMGNTRLPYLISFTIQSNGRLIDGTSIHDAIASIDDAAATAPLGYMANCVHPSIVRKALSQLCNQTNLVQTRFLGVQANTSALSYAELDSSPDLKGSKPEDWTEAMMALERENHIRIFGGCCGTDQRHMEALAKRLAAKNG